MNKNNKKTVFVGMSGGVDSSVAALILKRRGFEVVGIFMKNWSKNIEGVLNCSAQEDERFARDVAFQIGIPIYSWDFEKEYEKRVFDYFLKSYQNGLTPNPDVMCNQEIKFGLFLQKALKMGADYIATGHYVRLVRKIDKNGNRINNLLIAKDKNKDQSYFLWTLNQKKLNYCLFPIGNYLKKEVREIARQNNLITFDKKDSQGLCFIGKMDFRKFLAYYLPPKKGEIVLVSKNYQDGRVIGYHNGIQFYTIGQREGLNIGGGVPYYVVNKDGLTNTLYVATKENLNNFFNKKIMIENLNLIEPSLIFPLKCQGRFRYRQKLYKTNLELLPNNYAKVIFKDVPTSIAPGQSLVFYQGQKMLGGGIISSRVL